MSLINEALKKAQRQRAEGAEQTEAAPTDPGAATGPRVTRRDKPAGFRSQIVMAVIGGCAVLVIALAAAGFWFWRSGHKTEIAPPQQEVAAVRPPTTPTTAPAAVAPATTPPPPAAASKPAPEPVVAQVKPAPAATVAASPATAQFTLPLAPAPAQVTPAAPVATAPAIAEVAKPAERPKPSVHMIAIIENLRIQGIRAAGSDSKVLMNDRVYRLNDVVDHDLGFRLTAVTDNSLTFEDDHGATYTRNF